MGQLGARTARTLLALSWDVRSGHQAHPGAALGVGRDSAPAELSPSPGCSKGQDSDTRREKPAVGAPEGVCECVGLCVWCVPVVCALHTVLHVVYPERSVKGAP